MLWAWGREGCHAPDSGRIDEPEGARRYRGKLGYTAVHRVWEGGAGGGCWARTMTSTGCCVFDGMDEWLTRAREERKGRGGRGVICLRDALEERFRRMEGRLRRGVGRAQRCALFSAIALRRVISEIVTVLAGRVFLRYP